MHAQTIPCTDWVMNCHEIVITAAVIPDYDVEVVYCLVKMNAIEGLRSEVAKDTRGEW
jgi:hypothetical protein